MQGEAVQTQSVFCHQEAPESSRGDDLKRLFPIKCCLKGAIRDIQRDRLQDKLVLLRTELAAS